MAKVNSTESASGQVIDGAHLVAAERVKNPTLMAVIDLECSFVDMGSLLEAFDIVGGDDAPVWVGVIRAEFRRLETAMSLVSEAARGRSVVPQ